ncbi:MAG: nucleotidyltransferase family protein [Oculatellaceae cyanobacterium Prado106]|jgi:hypothetical protein|nr:nucleotidyltransferase family protein [Oculatellaceae cyanobacterium Prado106]
MKLFFKPSMNAVNRPLRLEHELLVYCSRVQLDATQQEKIVSLVQQDLDWPYLVQLAYRHGVMPLLYRSLNQTCPSLVPTETLQSLRHLFSTNAQRSLLFTAELLKFLKLFADHQMAAVPYKGPVLADTVYGDVAFRQYCDLDIVLQEQDILPAKQLLIEQGYFPKDPMTEAEEIAFLQSNDEHNYTFIRADRSVALELHWRITPRCTSIIEPRHFWEHLEPSTFKGVPFVNLSLEDWLPILCVHGSRHRWERLTWLCDVAEILRLRGAALDWDGVMGRSQVLICRKMLFLGVLLAHKILDAPVPPEVLRVMQSDAAVMVLMRQTYEQLMYETRVSDQFLGKTVYQMRVSDRIQEKALYLQSFLGWLVKGDRLELME